MTSLRSRYGDSPAMRRIVLDAERIINDVDLLDIDANDLDLGRCTATHSGEKIGVPDTQYDSATSGGTSTTKVWAASTT